MPTTNTLGTPWPAAHAGRVLRVFDVGVHKQHTRAAAAHFAQDRRAAGEPCACRERYLNTDGTRELFAVDVVAEPHPHPGAWLAARALAEGEG